MCAEHGLLGQAVAKDLDQSAAASGNHQLTIAEAFIGKNGAMRACVYRKNTGKTMGHGNCHGCSAYIYTYRTHLAIYIQRLVHVIRAWSVVPRAKIPRADLAELSLQLLVVDVTHNAQVIELHSIGLVDHLADVFGWFVHSILEDDLRHSAHYTMVQRSSHCCFVGSQDGPRTQCFTLHFGTHAFTLQIPCFKSGDLLL